MSVTAMQNVLNLPGGPRPPPADVNMADSIPKVEPSSDVAQAVPPKEQEHKVVAPSANNNSSQSSASAPSAAVVSEVKTAAEGDKKPGGATESPTISSSALSSANPDVLGDEIVVGAGPQATKPNGQVTSAPRLKAEEADNVMTAAEDDERFSHYPKRKRVSLHNDLSEDTVGGTRPSARDASATRPPQSRGRPNIAAAKGVLVGYWRDSPVPDEAGKHAVIGFMDVRDRLRTRIQNVTTGGAPINTRLFPIPPGPGGSWVTFDRVVFSEHLVGLNHHEVKEYVKVRDEAREHGSEDSLEAIKAAELAAVPEAKRRVHDNPPPETSLPVATAHGPVIPESTRPGTVKRRRLAGAAVANSADTPVASAAAPAPAATGGHAQPVPDHSMGGTRPTRILVGCWAKSDVPNNDGKHAVYGILGANDMFRVKLVRETMDGRFVDGNFPTGAGALWIPYEEVLFLPHITQLSRPEMKEYCRVRQMQIDAGETENMRVAHESQAVYEAQQRAALKALNSTASSGGPGSTPGDFDDAGDNPAPHDVLRREAGGDGRQARHSMGDIEGRNDQLERSHGHGRHAHMRHGNQRQGSATPTHAGDNRHVFRHNVQGLQGVWQANDAQAGPTSGGAAQQMQGVGASYPDGESVWHQGLRYQRKSTGPFSGKLVSSGTIISIDGEDYVEYRVLTRPLF